MSIELVKKEIIRFLSSKEPEVLCISGKWGVGKTYAWKKHLGEISPSLKKYAYVSLFGINSLDELKFSIFENTTKGTKIGSAADLESFDDVMSSTSGLLRKNSWIANFIPFLRSSYSALARTAFMSIRDQILCIDDYERKGDSINGKDILGLLSFLKEERKCKVVLILNEDALQSTEKENFSKYLEKVIDIKINFSPTSSEAVCLANLEQTNPEVAKKCESLGIKNIRVLKKIEFLVSKISPLLTAYGVKVQQQAAHSLTLLGWSVYDKDVAPSVEYLKIRNQYRDLFEKNKKTPEKEEAWNALLDAYKFTHMDDFDRALLTGIENGFFDPETISKTASKLDDEIKGGQSQEAISLAWRKFHDSFADDQEEVLKTILDVSKKHICSISGGTLNATVKLLKELGKPLEADLLIKEYVDKNKNNPEKFDFMRSPFLSGEIDDCDVIGALKKQSDAFKKPTNDPERLLTMLAEKHGWSNEEIAAAAKISEDQYYHIFKTNNGDKLRSIISFCLGFAAAQEEETFMRQVYTKTKNALIRIGKESPLNAMRVRKYGIKQVDEEHK